MSTRANHGFTLHNLTLEYRDDRVIARSRPLAIGLPEGEPVMNPRGVMLEQATLCLEKGLYPVVALTHGTNAAGEPLLDYIGYVGPERDAVFVNVRPTSLYQMGDALFRVSVVHVAVTPEGLIENSDAHSSLFLVTREGLLHPFEQTGAAMWPEELLDAVRDSSQAGSHYHVTTAADVKLDALYYVEEHDPETGDTRYDCYAVCRSEERTEWLTKAKQRVRQSLMASQRELQTKIDRLNAALGQLAP